MTWFDIAKSNILTTDPVDPGFNAPVGRMNSRGSRLTPRCASTAGGR